MEQQRAAERSKNDTGDAQNAVHAAHTSAGLWRYLNERFPPALVGMLAISFAAACLGLFSSLGLTESQFWVKAGGLAVLYLALLLRYRVVDEWKDHRHDTRHYPDRPVQRGAISPRTLTALGIGAVITELTLAVVLGGVAGLPLYAVITALTVGTAVDFGAREFFERRFTLGFVVHQLVYIPMFAWAAIALGAPLDEPRTWWGIAAATALFVSGELVRKFQPRKSAEGGVVADTYSAVWGRRGALLVLLLLVVAAGFCAHMAVGGWISLGVSVVAAIVVGARSQSDSWVMVGAGAHLPLLAIAMVL